MCSAAFWPFLCLAVHHLNIRISKYCKNLLLLECVSVIIGRVTLRIEPGNYVVELLKVFSKFSSNVAAPLDLPENFQIDLLGSLKRG